MEEKERQNKEREEKKKRREEEQKRKQQQQSVHQKGSLQGNHLQQPVQRRVELMIRQVVKSIPIVAAHALFTMTKLKLVLIGSLALVADGYMKTVWLM